MSEETINTIGRESRNGELSDVDSATIGKVVAWEVTLDDMSCITFATAAPKARWNAIFCAREAGYFKHRWPLTIRAKRREFLDRSPLRDVKGRKTYVENYVMDTL